MEVVVYDGKVDYLQTYLGTVPSSSGGFPRGIMRGQKDLEADKNIWLDTEAMVMELQGLREELADLKNLMGNFYRICKEMRMEYISLFVQVNNRVSFPRGRCKYRTKAGLYG